MIDVMSVSTRSSTMTRSAAARAADVRVRPERHAYVGEADGLRVVGPVTGHGHDAAGSLHRLHDPNLVRRGEAREDRDVLDEGVELRVGQPIELWTQATPPSSSPSSVAMLSAVLG